MSVREFDDFVKWLKRNFIDMPETDECLDMTGSQSEGIIGTGLAAAESAAEAAAVNLGPSRADMDRPTEYDFPISLLESILGLDRL